MKLNFLCALGLALLSALPSWAQEKPLRWGIEIEASPALSKPTSNIFSGYTGLYAEWYFTPRFSTKLSAGMYHTYHHGFPISEKPSFARSWGLSLEPRYYLFPEAKAWGNFYAALPISLKRSPRYINDYPALFALPTLGYRYEFNKHFAFEVSGGAGVLKEFLGREYASIPSTFFEYNLQARIGYNF
jgi:hypothetical protein